MAFTSFAPSTSTRPLRQSGYTVRPDPNYRLIRQMQPEGFFEGSGLDVSYRGRVNKYFTGFGRYTWSHYESNTDGIGWFPQNQYAPNDEWARRQLRPPSSPQHVRHGQPQEHLQPRRRRLRQHRPPLDNHNRHRLPTVTAFSTRVPMAWSATPRPLPSYVDLDLRWGHDFAITPSKDEEAPAARLLRRSLQSPEPPESHRASTPSRPRPPLATSPPSARRAAFS